MHTILCMFAVFLRFLFIITVLTAVAIVLASVLDIASIFVSPRNVDCFCPYLDALVFLTLSRVTRASLVK